MESNSIIVLSVFISLIIFFCFISVLIYYKTKEFLSNTYSYSSTHDDSDEYSRQEKKKLIKIQFD